MPNVIDAVLALVPDAKAELEGDTLDGLVWNEGNTQARPTDAAINSKLQELEAAASAQSIRNERDHRLTTEVDAIAGNALRWAALDSATQAEWATYRTDLLDVPQQAGVPHDVTWPTSPSLG